MPVMESGTVYPKPKTTIADKLHKVYPYLLRRLDVCYTSQVWAIDATIIPMKKGSLYLVAIIDGYSRKILACRLSGTMVKWSNKIGHDSVV